MAKEKDNRATVKAARINHRAIIIAAIIGLTGVLVSQIFQGKKSVNQEVTGNNAQEHYKALQQNNDSGFDSLSSKENIEKTTVTPSLNKKFTFYLVLNSDQVNSKILIDGKTARIISGHNTIYKEIEVERLGKEYSIQLINDDYNCEVSEYISSNHQKIYPCD